MLFNSLIISVFKYACPILINTKSAPLKKLNTLLMKCTRPILGFNSYKWSTTKIMKILGWVTIHHMIIIESILFIHKCIYENNPLTITELITYSINRDTNFRSIRKPMVRKEHSSIKVKQSLINKSIFLYNTLPDELKTYNPKKLAKYLRNYILEYFSNNTIPKNDIT